MSRISTWEKVGTESSSNDYRSLLKEADLDYDAVATDAYVEYEGSKILVPNKKVILRDDTQEVLGVVSDRYQLCQNRDALDFVDNLEDVKLLRAGGVGGMIWMIGQLPEVDVLGDKITPHLIFQNSHDGSCSVKTTICMLRMVCQNQFVASFKESPATINIRHQGDMDEKLIIARETMQGVYDYVRNYNSVANEMVLKRITPTKFNEIVAGYFKVPEDSTDRTKNLIELKRIKFHEAYEAEDNQNFKGTQWGVINAFSDFITHEESSRKTANWETNKFLNSLSPSTMNEFITYIGAAA